MSVVEVNNICGLRQQQMIDETPTAERVVKSTFHVLVAALSAGEALTAKTNLRRMLLGACAGWHIAACVVDLLDLRDEEP